MKVLVTGAGGFLGRAVVSACQAAGHDVIGLYRRSAAAGTPPPESVAVVIGDLRQPGDWQKVAGEVSAVIHCASATSGDLSAQLAGTVMATENLLAALGSDLTRFVHVSSFSVYDFNAPRLDGRLDETTALESMSLRRDAYTQTKLIQERMVWEHCQEQATPLAIIRPGLIYGPGKNWNYGRAIRAGRFDFIFAPFSRMRLTYVTNCAEAIVAALEAPLAGVEAFNIVDDTPPTFWTYYQRSRRSGARLGIGVPVPYWSVLFLGLLARLASRLFFGGRARLPEMLDMPRQQVQWRPLAYDNSKARQGLNWHPEVTLDQGIAETVVRHSV